jgi:probable HAF family extracellular repeat protein
VVGASTTSTANQLHAFAYNGTSLLDVGTLGTGNVSEAFSVNSKGIIVGGSNTVSGGSLVQFEAIPNGSGGFTLTNIGSLPGGGKSDAYGVNDSGAVVGYSTTAPGSPTSVDATYFVGGKLYDLNNLVVPGQKADFVNLNVATGVNNNGTVVGVGKVAGGQLHAFIAIPVPETSPTLLMFFTSGVMMVWRRMRRLA